MRILWQPNNYCAKDNKWNVRNVISEMKLIWSIDSWTARIMIQWNIKRNEWQNRVKQFVFSFFHVVFLSVQRWFLQSHTDINIYIFNVWYIQYLLATRCILWHGQGRFDFDGIGRPRVYSFMRERYEHKETHHKTKREMKEEKNAIKAMSKRKHSST